MRTSYGYDTYRGRSRTRTVLMAIIVILLVVLLLAIAAFFFLQQFMVYTDDGQWHLELPFLQNQEEIQSTLPPVESQTIIVVTPPPTPSPTPEPEPTITAVWLLRSSITEGNAAQLVQSLGGNAAVFNMKSDDGMLGYVSDLPLARDMRTSQADPGLNDAIRTLNDSGLYTIARVSCFKDNAAPRMNNSLAIKTNSGYNWTDAEGIRWTNVAAAEARSYLVDICKELAELGFDEILLENAAYPVEGNLSHIKEGDTYDPEELSTPVEQFYREVAEALEGTGVKLSIATQPAVLDGAGDESGQTPALLGAYAQRVYVTVPETADAYSAALREAGLEEKQLVYSAATNLTADELDEGISTLVMFSSGIKK